MSGDKPDVDLTDRSPKGKRKKTRKWSQITGITLHQTGIHGFSSKAWRKVTSHLGVHDDGTIYLIHPLEAYLWASNSLNKDTVAIEVCGNFRFCEDDEGSYWKKGGGPTLLSDDAREGIRRAIRFIVNEVAANGGEVRYIYAHRQGRRAKSLCPGELVWKAGGVWAQEELGLSDGGFGYKRKTGRPIPSEWDPRFAARQAGIEGPFFFSASDYRYEIDDDAFASVGEHPDEDEEEEAGMTPFEDDDDEDDDDGPLRLTARRPPRRT